MFHVEHGKSSRFMNIEFFKKTIELAEKACFENEVPVGAVVVKDNKIIGCGYNKKEQTKDPTMHAEFIAIREACNFIGDWRLDDCDLYVTLKPCMMCCGLVVETRIRNVYYILDKCEQLYDNKHHILQDFTLKKYYLNLLQNFFKKLRNK